jgi:hypothetical protein
MRNGKLSRRSVLKGSTAFAAHSLFPKLLKAAAPDPTAVTGFVGPPRRACPSRS